MKKTILVIAAAACILSAHARQGTLAQQQQQYKIWVADYKKALKEKPNEAQLVDLRGLASIMQNHIKSLNERIAADQKNGQQNMATEINAIKAVLQTDDTILKEVQGMIDSGIGEKSGIVEDLAKFSFWTS